MRDDGEGYEYWWSALDGRFGSIQEGRPQNGFFRTGRGSGADPVAIWHDSGGFLHILRGRREVHGEDCGEVWMACAKHPVTEDEYNGRMTSGRWPSDPPDEIPAATEEEPDRAAPPPTNGAVPGPGHNSDDLAAFRAMREDILNDIAEARAHFRRNPIRSKTDADLCENWRQRIHAKAARFEAMRVEERRPHNEKLDEIQARYKPVLDDAKAVAAARGELDNLGQGWIRAERARLQREAEEKARTEMETRRAAAEAEWKRVEEERARILAERQAQIEADPIAAHTSPGLIDPPVLPELPDVPDAALQPVVAAPKVMIGTGATRRGAREAPHTATITDLKAAAAYYAEIRHPQLVELIQKLANAAARSPARSPVPGCMMSWDGGKAA